MGSIMAALNMSPPPPQQQRRLAAYKACFDDHHEELQKMLQQSGLDIDWAEPVHRCTAAYIAAHKGNDKCLARLINS
jgi:hypothetical protein